MDPVVLPLKLPFVGVVWGDASGSAHVEYTLEEAHQVHKVSTYLTLGFLAIDDATGVTLFSEECLDDKGLRGRAFIPRGMVVRTVQGDELARLLQLAPATPRRARRRRAASSDTTAASSAPAPTLDPGTNR